jgi:hypothetical protein
MSNNNLKARLREAVQVANHDRDPHWTRIPDACADRIVRAVLSRETVERIVHAYDDLYCDGVNPEPTPQQILTAIGVAP